MTTRRTPVLAAGLALVALAMPGLVNAAPLRKQEDVRKRTTMRVTKEQRAEAARRQKALKEQVAKRGKIVKAKKAKSFKAGPSLSKLATTSKLLFDPVTGGPAQGGIPDYFGNANWAYSPPLKKFVVELPGLGAANASQELGTFLSVGKPDTITYPGSDYYEIDLVEISQKMHPDLPPTRVRTYQQVNLGTSAQGVNEVQPDPAHYLGVNIIAKKDRPVRIKFTNRLPVGPAGDLFIPVDRSVMGSGEGHLGPEAGYLPDNRAELHLHGGRTPWISDGTPHQWITPAEEPSPYDRGVSAQNVPDMPDPGEGSLTYYYTNQQSARLLFYHDHTTGLTRLNVYVGEAAGYLLRDEVEEQLITDGVIPGGAYEIPLVIQDKTFVDATTILETDPTWNWGTGTPDENGIRPPQTGDLWYPHVYVPAQNPFDPTGVNPYGRWAYGPWFWPPTNVTYMPVPNPYFDPVNAPWQPPEMPPIPNPSIPGEGFMDTPVVNGAIFPYLEVEPTAYRFRVLNAANDRFFNLQMYIADPDRVTDDGRTMTEVRMVPATSNPTFPAGWPTDNREGGVPDPAFMGPDFIAIGSEGGFLPAPAVVKNQPVGWNNDPTTFNAGNVVDFGLLLGPAERADVIVDFSQFAGKTIILYNDAPAAFPALDVRYDYYTDAPDYTDSGGHGPIAAGYGPNTRTIMQFRVKAAPEGTTPPAFDLARLEDAFKTTAAQDGVFKRGQDPIIVGQPAYDAVYDRTFTKNWPCWGLARIQDTSMCVETVSGNQLPNFPLHPKAIQDEMGESFDPDFGRMSSKLGLELPNTNAQNQNFVLQNYVDPPTEILQAMDAATEPNGVDGTQIWKITHNGVDTHPVHFHLFDVQLLNRVGWDGAIRAPHPTELGWKDTIRISPLEDTIVALRPVQPKQPFGIPDSVRVLNPDVPVGSTMGFTNINPTTGQAITPPVSNQLHNFGWEYVWHCHILAHEENDMMRPMSLYVPTQLAPAPALTAIAGSEGVSLTWTDGTPGDLPATIGDPRNEIGFVVQRAAGLAGEFADVGRALANQTGYTDATAEAGAYYRYRVVAFNTAGESPSNVARVGEVTGEPATSVVVSATPASPLMKGLTPVTPPTFTAEATGGTGAYEYQFSLGSADVFTVVQEFGPSASWTMPAGTAPGAYQVKVDVRTSTTSQTDASVTTDYAITTPAPATELALTPSVASPQVTGTAVTFTATATGDSERQYRFSLATNGGAFQIVQDWSATASWALPTGTAGHFDVKVDVRTSLVTVDGSATAAFDVVNPPATGVTLRSSKPTPHLLTEPPVLVTFLAMATGSKGYSYQFYLSTNGGPFEVVQPWSTQWYWTMPGTVPVGNQKVKVDVRTSEFVAVDVTATMDFVLKYPAATGVTLTPSLPSPQVQGTAVTFTAQGQGSSAGGYQYRFYLRNLSETTFTMVQDFSPSNTWTLESSTPVGDYQVVAWVRTNPLVTTRDAQISATFTIRPTAASGVTLRSNITSPAVEGMPVTFTAEGQGASSYEYRFYFREVANPTFTMVQDYGPSATWTMPGTTPAGDYQVVVWVRSSPIVTTRDAQTSLLYAVRLSPATGVTLTPSTQSPAPTGTEVNFIAQGQGSSGYEYRFYFRNMSSTTFTMVQDYSTNAAWALPAATPPGDYQVVVWVRTSKYVTTTRDVQTSVIYRITP